MVCLVIPVSNPSVRSEAGMWARDVAVGALYTYWSGF